MALVQPPAQRRTQTIHDYAITGKEWEKYLAVKIAPFVCDFYALLYEGCLKYAEDYQKAHGQTVDPVEHFARALGELNLDSYTDQIDKIIEKLPELSTAFKMYFVAYAWVLTSVRLQQNAGGAAPALTATLPTKRQIIKQLMEEAMVQYVTDPALIVKSRRVAEKKVRKIVPVALLKLIQRSDFMETFLKSMKTERQFAPSASAPVPQIMAPPTISSNPSVTPRPKKHRHKRVPSYESSSSSSSYAIPQSSSSSSEESAPPHQIAAQASVDVVAEESEKEAASESEVSQHSSNFEIVEKDDATGIMHVTSGEFGIDPKTGAMEIDSSSIVETEQVEPTNKSEEEVEIVEDSVIDELPMP
jgi:hypothetical protein